MLTTLTVTFLEGLAEVEQLGETVGKGKALETATEFEGFR